MKLAIGPILHRRQMTQAALADAIDVKRGFMSEIVAGKKLPSLDTLAKIAQALQVSYGELFGEAAPTLPSAPSIPGMADEAVPFDWKGFRDPKRMGDAIDAAQAGLRHPATYRIAAAAPWAGLLPGDILVCDLSRQPADGDLILVGITDADGFNARTVIRRSKGHFALSADPGELEPIIDLDADHRAAWRATICGLVRIFSNHSIA